MKNYFPILILLVFSCCSSPGTKNPVTDTLSQTPVGAENGASGPEANIEIRVFPVSDSADMGYGYDILLDGKLYIHQPNIPSLPGNNGFRTIAKTQVAAEFVATKISHKIMPPSVTKAELDSLKVLD